MSLSRSFGTCTKGGTCFIRSSLSCSTLFLSSIERFMNAIGYIGLIESQCKISGRRLPSLSALHHRIELECNTVGFSTHHRVPFIIIIFFFFLIRCFPGGHTMVNERRENGRGRVRSLPSRGQLPGPSSPALKNLSTRNHECLLATSCVSVLCLE